MLRISNFKYFALLNLSFLNSSCDCLQNVSGIVVDKETKQPLDSVFVKKSNHDYVDTTNETGTFKLKYVSRWCNCGRIKVSAIKNGYQPTIVKIKNLGSKIIYLTKTNDSEQVLSKNSAILIAKRDSIYQIKKIQSANLITDSVTKILCWVVVEKVNVKKEQNKISRSDKTGMNYIVAHIIKINATNGQVVRREIRILGSIHKHSKF